MRFSSARTLLLISLSIGGGSFYGISSSQKAEKVWHIRIDTTKPSSFEWVQQSYRAAHILAHMQPNYDAVGSDRVGECPKLIASSLKTGDFYEGNSLPYKRERKIIHQLSEVFETRFCLYPTSKETALVFEVI